MTDKDRIQAQADRIAELEKNLKLATKGEWTTWELGMIEANRKLTAYKNRHLEQLKRLRAVLEEG
jgi:hypothetical protein